jgi:hypothetical protein
MAEVFRLWVTLKSASVELVQVDPNLEQGWSIRQVIEPIPEQGDLL